METAPLPFLSAVVPDGEPLPPREGSEHVEFKTFLISRNMTYQEIATENPLFEKFYEIHNPCNEHFFVIPDGHVDIQYLWRNDQEVEVQIVGSFRQGGMSQITQYQRCFGGRFRTGLLPRTLRGRVEEVIEHRCMTETFFKLPPFGQNMDEQLPLKEKALLLLRLMDQVEVLDENIIIKRIMREIEQNHGKINVGELIESTGYSHRYIDRVFKSVMGFPIKKYANIMRLQESVTCVCGENQDAIYDELGYYDQAHFIHDFKRFTSFTPIGLKNRIGQYRIV